MSGHSGAVKALACSPDGNRLASGGNDQTVRIWDVGSGQELMSFAVAEGFIASLAFSPDGEKLATGTSAGTVTLRNLADGRELFKLSDHAGGVTALSFSPDGRFLASGSADETVKIRDVGQGRRIKNLKGHTDRIEALRFSRDGETLASAGFDQTIRIWKTSSGRGLSVFKGHTGKVLALDFTSDGKLLSADSDYAVKLWDVFSKTLINSVKGQSGGDAVNEAESAAFSFDGRYLASGGGDRTIVLTETKNGKRLKLLENQTSGFYGVAFSSNRNWLASAGFDNTVRLWDLQTGQSLPPLVGHTGYVTSVAFHPDNRRIISASVDQTIRIWDALAEKLLHTLKNHTDSISGLALDSQGKLLVSGSADQTIGLWNLEINAPAGRLRGHTGEVTSVAMSPDDTIIASAGRDKTIRLWDTRTQTLLRTIASDFDEVETIAFSPDGQMLASGGVDKKIRLWDVAAGRLMQTIEGHGGKINTLFFSPDGKQIVSGGRDKTIRLWNLSSGRQENVFTGHAGTIFSLSLSADGHWLASGSDDGSIILWNRETASRTATLVSLKNSEDWLVVSPQGFFDGSPAAWEQLFWRFERNTFNVKPVEVFFNEFYSPGLLADLLAGEKLPTTGDISSKDRRQPSIKISLAGNQTAAEPIAERRIRVKVEVAEAAPGNGFQTGSGARDVRLFRNGSLVKFWSGNVLDKDGKTELETTVSLVSGQNQLTAYAFNNENIKSGNAQLIVSGSEKLKRKGVFYIVAIGVGKYANPKYDLNYVELDAREFSETLRQKQAELKQYERVEVITLLNREATKSNMLALFKRLAGTGIADPTQSLPPGFEKLKAVQPEDTVAIFYSGHGTSQNGHFYVLPYDLGYTDPEMSLTAQLLKTVLFHSVSDVEMEIAFREIDAAHLLLVIDACNSGQALESEDKRRGPMNTKGLAQLAYDKGMYILTASQSVESAYVSEALKRSYLSFALTEEGLKTPVADTAPNDGQLSIREWFEYAANRVPLLRRSVAGGAEKIEQGKGLEEEEEIKNKGTQRPRVFYRRQANPGSLIISQIQ